MLAIDPTARVAPGAVIGADVNIGPYCVIVGANVERCATAASSMAHVHRRRPPPRSARGR